MLPGESVATPERRRRFALEAKAASALNHPNIVTVYDIDVADGVDFIAMEYVAGSTLAELTGAMPIAPPRESAPGTSTMPSGTSPSGFCPVFGSLSSC